MLRALVYVLLLGLVTGVTAGVALFGLPLAGEAAEGEAPPGPVAAFLLERGVALDDAAVAAGGLAALLLLVLGLADLGRRSRRGW